MSDDFISENDVLSFLLRAFGWYLFFNFFFSPEAGSILFSDSCFLLSAFGFTLSAFNHFTSSLFCSSPVAATT
ncbi:hypothetical protein EFY79_08705 [Hanamia caeni]|uniref:Uncharacterized protein n=1 Tax=Hanamia caeni TaxID=2294116 RepID=A0A3M9NJV5_9BACT|nr:hypothetical protein EFY79_08705 [Hanamia caeni]